MKALRAAAVEIVQPAAELASPVPPEPNPSVQSSAASVIFEEIESPSHSSQAPERRNGDSEELAGASNAAPSAMDVATWMASRPPIDEHDTAATASIPVETAMPVEKAISEPPLIAESAAVESFAVRDLESPSNVSAPDEAATLDAPPAHLNWPRTPTRRQRPRFRQRQ